MKAAGLPLGVEAESKGWGIGAPELTRVLAGLRASTLKKRYSDIQPFLRWVRAHYGIGFAHEDFQVLSYFGVRAEERAARSV